ncbi:MAG: hypothetical protein GY774_35515 [Planctomycetes bacterium]|nr:hypothetical protein [Planctomycetota bacterium]
MNDEIFRSKLDELEKYARMEGSELGEYCSYLLSIWHSYRDMMSSAFHDQVHDEILIQLENFKDNTQIVKRTQTTKAYEFDELEWIS